MAQIKGIWKLRKAGALPSHFLAQKVNYPLLITGEMMNGIAFRKAIPTFESDKDDYWNTVVYFHDFDKYTQSNVGSDLGITLIEVPGPYDHTVSDSVTWTDGNMPNRFILTLDFGTDGQEVSEEFYYWVQKNMIEQPRSIEGTWHVQSPVCNVNYPYNNDQGVSLHFTDMNGKEYVAIKEDVDDLGNVTFQAIDAEGATTAFIRFPHFDDELPTMAEEFTSITVTGADDHAQALQFLLCAYNKEPVATFDLSTLDLDDQVHTITVVAKADNYSESLESSTARYDLANEEPEFTGSVVSITNTSEDTSELTVYDGLTTSTVLGTVPAGETVDFTIMGEYIRLESSSGAFKAVNTIFGVYATEYDGHVYAVTGNGTIVCKSSQN